jgi:hypothetical protein
MRSDYEEIDQLRNGGKLKDYAGFADCGAGTAFVAPDEADPEDDVLTPLGMGSRVTTTVTHEAAHLAAGAALPYAGRCPWFDEGLAEVVAERVLLARDSAADAGAQPALCAAMRACMRLRGAGALPSPREILAARPERFATSAEYAVAWAFFRLLNEPSQRDRTAKLLVRARGLPPGRDFPAVLEGIAKSVWGEDGLAELAEEWPKYVDAFAPQWGAFDGRLCVRGGRWAHVAARGETVSAWRTRTAGAKDFVVSGDFTILPRGAGEAALLLGETERGGVVVLMSSTRGVNAYGWDGTTQTVWIGAEPAARPKVGERTRFEVRVAGGEVLVALGGRFVARGPLLGHDTTGGWGVSAFDGSAVVWDNVELK